MMRARSGCAIRVDDVGRSELLNPIHAHVERSLFAIREAAPRRVEVHRGDPEVVEDAVDGPPVRPADDPFELIEVSLDEPDALPEAGESLACDVESRLVSVDAEEPAP